MMGGGAFIPLKAGQNGLKSAKQAEIGLANLLIILRISRFGTQKLRQNRKRCAKVDRSLWFPLDMANL